VTLALLTLTGCSTPHPAARASLSNLSGTFYLLVGPDNATLDVYRVTHGKPGYTRLTVSPHHGGVDTVTVGGGIVVLADSRSGHDQIGTLSPDGWFHVLPALNSIGKNAPALSPDGTKLCYIETRLVTPDPTHTGHDVFHMLVHVLTMSSGVDRVALDSPYQVQDAQWGPDGQVVVLESGGVNARLVLVRTDGTQTILPTNTPTALGMVVSATTGRIAVTFKDDHQHTPIFDRKGRRLATLSGWRVMAWSPDGSELLATPQLKAVVPDYATVPSEQKATMDDLTLLSGPTFENVTHLAPSPVGPVWTVDWASG